MTLKLGDRGRDLRRRARRRRRCGPRAWRPPPRRCCRSRTPAPAPSLSAATWATAGGMPQLAAGGALLKEVSGEPVLFLRPNGRVYAYRPACPACGDSLQAARLQGAELACPGCGHRFDVLRAGRCLPIRTCTSSRCRCSSTTRPRPGGDRGGGLTCRCSPARASRACIAGPPAAPAPGAEPERCELCDAPIGPGHRHLLARSTHELLCACRPCALLFDRDGAGGGRYRLVPERAGGWTTSRSATRSGRSCASPSTSRSSSTAASGARGGLLPGPDGPGRVAADARRVGSAWPATTRCWRDLMPDVEALLVCRARGAREHWLVRDRRVLRARRPDPHALAGPDRRAARSGRRSTGSSTELPTGGSDMAKVRTGERRSRAPTRRRTCRASSRATAAATTRHGGAQPRRDVDRGALDGHRHRLQRADRPAHAEPLAGIAMTVAAQPASAAAAVPQLSFAVQDAEPDGTARSPDGEPPAAHRRAAPGRRCARSCSTSSCRSPRRARGYDAARAGGARRAVRRPGAAGGRRCARLLWTRATLVVPAFDDATVVTLTVACSYDLEVTADQYLPRCATATCRSSCCSAARSSTRADGGCRRRASAGTARRTSGCRSACGARRWTATSPAPRGCASDRDTFDRLRAYKARHGAARPGTTRSRRLLPMTDPVRRIADAVLYEGYVLWPYRRSALKNQQRWTFGGVYPPARGDDRSLLRAQVLLEGEAPHDGGRARALPARRRAPGARAATSAARRRAGRGRRALADVGRGGRARRRPGPRWRSPPARRWSRSPAARSAARGARCSGEVDGAAREPLRDGLWRVTVGVDNASRWRGLRRARTRCARRCARPTRSCAPAAARSSRATDPPPGPARRRGGVRATRGCGPCWSASPARATRCWPRRSSSPTIRRSRPRAPATCSTAARSTSCSCSTSSR